MKEILAVPFVILIILGVIGIIIENFKFHEYKIYGKWK